MFLINAVDQHHSRSGDQCCTEKISSVGVGKQNSKNGKIGKTIDVTHSKAHGVAATEYIRKFHLSV